MTTRIRLVRKEDAGVLAELLAANREFMAPWDAIRSDAFYTPPGQAAEVGRQLEQHEQGVTMPLAIIDDDGSVAGALRLNGIARGPFQSCSLGYWVAQPANGRGLATAAVAAALDLAFGELGLHRVQAETLRDNVRSQQVLAKNGFERIGTAPQYLRIAGEWQDHHLYQRLAPA